MPIPARVTLDKTRGRFSATTRYRDDAINGESIHGERLPHAAASGGRPRASRVLFRESAGR